jgi:hypothetical protein
MTNPRQVQTVNCAICGTTFERPAWRIKQSKLRGQVRHFCSASCVKAAPRKSLGARRYGATQADKRTLEHNSWSAMWLRCTLPTHEKFALYKDKTPPDAWLDFRVFLADMGRRPNKRHTLERVDNSKPYGPSNCVWATPSAQMRNNTRTRFLTFNSVTLCITDWAARSGLHETTLRRRINDGWPIEKALNTSSQAGRRA